MKTKIILNSVRHAYGKREVISDATAEFRPGTLSVIFGRNGSGKSTLVKLIAGILPLQQGTIQFRTEGKSASDGQKIKFYPGYFGQHARTIFPFSAEEYILTGRTAAGTFAPSKKDHEHVERAITAVGIGSLRQRSVTELSGGEMQLVRLARLIAQDSKILLLDEPVTHLDIAHQIEILALMKKIVSSGITVVAVLHDPTLGLLYGDDFYYIIEGELYKAESAARLAQPELLEKIFGCTLETIPYGTSAVILPPPPMLST